MFGNVKNWKSEKVGNQKTKVGNRKKCENLKKVGNQKGRF